MNPLPAFLYASGGPMAMFLVIIAAWICVAKFVQLNWISPRLSLLFSAMAVIICGLDFAWDVNFLTGMVLI